MAELNLEAIEARAKRTHGEVVRLCKTGEHWRMSIPAQLDRDSDLIISATVDDAEALVAEVKRLREQIQRVRDRHGALKIYTECGHDGDEDCTGEIVEIESSVGWTCEDGYLYSICRECCTEGGEQTEVCAAHHDHRNGPLCPTRKDIDGDPADDGSQTDG